MKLYRCPACALVYALDSAEQEAMKIVTDKEAPYCAVCTARYSRPILTTPISLTNEPPQA